MAQSKFPSENGFPDCDLADFFLGKQVLKTKVSWSVKNGKTKKTLVEMTLQFVQKMFLVLILPSFHFPNSCLQSKHPSLYYICSVEDSF